MDIQQCLIYPSFPKPIHFRNVPVPTVRNLMHRRYFFGLSILTLSSNLKIVGIPQPSISRFVQTPAIVYPQTSTVKQLSTISSPQTIGHKMTCTDVNSVVWDLAGHFGWSGWKDPKLEAAVKHLEEVSKSFNEAYLGNLKTKLEESIKKYEEIETLKTKIQAFLNLIYDTDQKNAELLKFKTVMDAKISKVDADYLTFYAIEMAKLSDDEVAVQMSSTLEFYKSFIRNVRKMRPHLLSQDVERALTLRDPWASSDPVVDYYEKQLSLSLFNFKGEQVNLETLLSNLQKPDATIRREALKALNHFAALSLNLVAGSWHIENEERKYPELRSRRNLSNDITDGVVDSLLAGVRTKGVQLARRYYLLKKEILRKTQGLKEFTWADRNAPLALKTGEKRYTWDEAIEIVAKGYKRFSPTLHDLFRKQVDEKRIHAPACPGKKSGAYCCGVVPGLGPFQLDNFVGTPHDVATVAHESGHGAHFLLSYEQGILQYHPPLTLAEVASIFGEMIVFQDLLAKCDTDEERLSMLLEKIDSIVNSVVRQCSFDKFEQLFHEARRTGVIDDADFDKFWMEATYEYYGKEGDVFDKYEDMNHLWAYVSHFHCVPFYVYSYAFADLVVGALYSVYKQKPDDFEPKLLSLLKSGSTKTFVEPFGLQPDKPEFWINALTVHLEPLIGQAEAISKKIYS